MTRLCPNCGRPLKIELHPQGAVYFLKCPPCGLNRWGIRESTEELLPQERWDEEESSGE